MTSDRKTLDFLVIGAQKCATSWLFMCLAEHPQLKLPKNKRENAYIGGPLFQENGASWFFDRYEGFSDGCLVGDVSVDYLFDEYAIDTIKAYIPDGKFIVSIRNPVDRFKSAYYWNLRKGILAPNVSLSDAIREGVLYLEKGDAVNPVIKEMVERGNYGTQIERFVDYFGAEKIHLVMYDDVKKDPGKVVRSLYDFLEVDVNFSPKSLSRRPKKNAYSSFLNRLEGVSTRIKPLVKLIDIYSQRIAGEAEAPQVDPELEAQFAISFEHHVRETAMLLSRLHLDTKPLDLSVRWALGEKS